MTHEHIAFTVTMTKDGKFIKETDVGNNLVFHYYGEENAPAGQGKEAQVYDDIYKSILPGEKFEDAHFPPNDESLGGIDLRYSSGRRKNIQWHRPAAIAKSLFGSDSEPIFHGPYDQFGVNQGEVGDCWFLAVLADVARHPDAINTLVPLNNTFEENGGFEKGIFHFRFWFRGSWIDVAVDDQLPCIMDFDGVEIISTAFTRPTKTGGFWAPLLEKAYAKLYGNYNAIAGGFSVDAMKDFTGGFILTVGRWGHPNWELQIKKYYNGTNLMAIGTVGKFPPDLLAPHDSDNPGDEDVSREGIVCGHAYSLLGLHEVTNISDPSQKTTLIRVRNPWGNETEWNGPFADNDIDGWNQVTPNLRVDKLNRSDDGEFYIPVQNLARYIDSLYVCVWDKDYRGISGKSTFQGSTVCQYIGNFPKANSGRIETKDQLFHKEGYLISLILPTDSNNVGNKCEFIVNMLYNNFKKSGHNKNIPTFGFYMCWAPGTVEGEEFARSCGDHRLCLGPYGRPRDINFTEEQDAGTILLIPWIKNFEDGMEEKTEFVIRIAVEGEVKKIESLM